MTKLEFECVIRLDFDNDRHYKVELPAGTRWERVAMELGALAAAIERHEESEKGKLRI